MRIHEAKVPDHDEQWHERHLTGNHHRRNDDPEDQVPPWKLLLRQNISSHRVDEQDTYRNDDCNVNTVEKPFPNIMLLEQVLEASERI